MVVLYLLHFYGLRISATFLVGGSAEPGALVKLTMLT